MDSEVLSLFPELQRQLLFTTGILPSQMLRDYVDRGYIRGKDAILPDQVQPSSIDLRLGSVAYRVRASFLANENTTVLKKVESFKEEEIDLGKPALLERGNVYLVPLKEELALPKRVSGKANPKSSTGRLDVFTRLIVDYGRHFEIAPAGYHGPLYAEIVPRTFDVYVQEGARLNQLRLVAGQPQPSDATLQELDRRERLVFSSDESPAGANISKGLRLSVDLEGIHGSEVIGYRARHNAPPLDLKRVGEHDPQVYWEPLYRSAHRYLVLNRDDFYILASREKVRIPPEFAAEMVPFDPSVGEFRIHYAGFFDPGFGYGMDDIKGTHAVLEVRSHEVPFVMEDGQEVGRLIYERLLAVPDILYGQGIGSSYQRQGLKLSKHFREFAGTEKAE